MLRSYIIFRRELLKMKPINGLLMVCLVTLPVAAMGETYKCVSSGGKIKYTNQMSYEKGVTCEQMFVRKPPTVTADPQASASAQTPAEPVQSGEESGESAAPDAAKTAPAAPVAPQQTQADKDLEAKRKKAEADEAKQKAGKEAEAKQAEQKAKEAMERNCQNAKGNLATYKMGRVRRVDDKGEQYYLDDAAVKEGLAQAEKDVTENCK